MIRVFQVEGFSIITIVKTHSTSITSLEQVNNSLCVRINGPSFLRGLPGQFFQAFAVCEDSLLPTLLYPCKDEEDSLLLSGSIPKGWQPGTELHLRGPRGNGFHLPPLARRIVLTTLDKVNVNRLLPLAELALQNGASVTLFTDTHQPNLAPEIEVLPLEELSGIKEWADTVAAVLHHHELSAFFQKLDLIPGRKIPFEGQIMLDVPMICDEASACGLCAVRTSKGWKLACKDGPVFPLEDLIGLDVTNE